MEPPGTKIVRGIIFPVECLQAACFETGGALVEQEELIRALDRARANHIRQTGKEPERLILSKEPAIQFIPYRVRIHNGPMDVKGRPSNLVLYFAAPKVFVV